MILKKFLIFGIFAPCNSYNKNCYQKVSVYWFVATFLDNAHNPSLSNGKGTLCSCGAPPPEKKKIKIKANLESFTGHYQTC